jgi:hypothetical protein
LLCVSFLLYLEGNCETRGLPRRSAQLVPVTDFSLGDFLFLFSVRFRDFFFFFYYHFS